MSTFISRRQFLAGLVWAGLPALRQSSPPGYRLDLPPQPADQSLTFVFILTDTAGQPAPLPNSPYSVDFGVYTLRGLRLLRPSDMTTTLDTSDATITITIPKATMTKYPARFVPTAQYRLLITDSQSVASPLLWGLFKVSQ